MPQDIKETFNKLGIPEAEQKFLQGVSAQYDSESVYHNIQSSLEDQGVIFLDMDSALREYPGRSCRNTSALMIPSNDNKYRRLEYSRMVRRQLHLHPAWRRGGNALAGLFPHQHAEYGAI